MGGYAMEQVYNVAASAHPPVNDLHTWLFYGGTKLASQHPVNAGTHEIDNLLRGIHDAVGIGAFDRVSLEEAFVDSIQKVLTLQPTVYAPGRSLYRHVKAIKRLEELVTVKGAASECINDFFNFSSDGIMTEKIRVIEDSAEKAFGQEVL